MKRQSGFTLLEILIAVIIIAVGLLGIAALQGHSSRAEMESYQRAQALVLVSDMLNRIEANRTAKQCYADLGVPSQAGTDQPGAFNCVAYGVVQTQETANNDLLRWHQALLGSAEQLGGTRTGSMIKAYGCVTYDGIDAITVSVFWQGLAPTLDSAVPGDCHSVPNYGAGMRRGVSRSLRLPILH